MSHDGTVGKKKCNGQPYPWWRTFADDIDALDTLDDRDVKPFLRIEVAIMASPPPVRRSIDAWERISGSKRRPSFDACIVRLVTAGRLIVIARDHETMTLTTPAAQREWEWRAETSLRKAANRNGHSKSLLKDIETNHGGTISEMAFLQEHKPELPSEPLKKNEKYQSQYPTAVPQPFSRIEKKENNKENNTPSKSPVGAPYASGFRDGETMVSNEDEQKRRNAEAAPSEQLRQALREQVNR